MKAIAKKLVSLFPADIAEIEDELVAELLKKVQNEGE